MRGITSKSEKNEKSRLKNRFCGAVRGWNEAVKSRPPKGTFNILTKYTYQISTF